MKVIIFFIYFLQDFCPKYAVVLPSKAEEGEEEADDFNSVTLVVRGTYSSSDVCVDLLGDEEPFLEGFAHR